MDLAIIVIYLAAMVAFGWWGKARTSDRADFLVVSAVAYVVVSLLTRPTEPAVMREWTDRLAGEEPQGDVAVSPLHHGHQRSYGDPGRARVFGPCP